MLPLLLFNPQTGREPHRGDPRRGSAREPDEASLGRGPPALPKAWRVDLAKQDPSGEC